jgi:sugar lactone lactonase YvrE
MLLRNGVYIVVRSMTVLVALAFLVAACGGGNGASNANGGSNSNSGGSSGTTTPSIALFAGNMGGAGNVNGLRMAARFRNPVGVAADSVGNFYVLESSATPITANDSTDSIPNNNYIRKIAPDGTVSLFAGNPAVSGSADGIGAAASFNNPTGIATDSTGNVYVSDNQTIRKITPAGVVTTLAGTAGVRGDNDGIGAAASFYAPRGLATDSAGNVYVADSDDDAIRKITPAGVVTTFAGANVSGNLAVATATLNAPEGVAVDGAGNVYVVCFAGYVVKITPSLVVSTLAGNNLSGAGGLEDGIGAAAWFFEPTGVTVDANGNLYVADTGNRAVRKITPNGTVTTLAGKSVAYGLANGSGGGPTSVYSTGITSDSAGNIYVADTVNVEIRKITPDGTVSTWAGSSDLFGNTNGAAAAATFNEPYGIVADNAGNLYVNDAGNSSIRKITQTGAVNTLAGIPADYVPFNSFSAAYTNLKGIAVDSTGNVYVADMYGAIDKVTPAGAVTAFAGVATGVCGNADGTGTAAVFCWPTGIAVDKSDNVYVVDLGNSAIRKITPAGVVTTLAKVTLAPFSYSFHEVLLPGNILFSNGMAIDPLGNIFVADTGNNIILKITPDGTLSTFAGSVGAGGSSDGNGATASFNYPQGLATDHAGNVYVADTGNNAIRKITPAGKVSTVVGESTQIGFAAGTLPGVLSSPLGVAISGSSLYITTYNGVAVVNNVP